jgi:prephenate dehydrogenase
MTVRKWRQIAVVGCGLIGSSFALALKRNQICERVLGWDISTRVLDEALDRGIIDEVDQSFAKGAVSEAELIYLAMPILQIVQFLRDCGSQLRSGAVITDSGSTKRAICKAASLHLPATVHFVGGHPIAGSHHSGPKYATADMFAASSYVLTLDNSPPDVAAFNEVRDTIAALGSQVHIMTAAEHDRAFALVSHLPQLLSSALATTVAQQPDSAALNKLAGPAFKDMTRLAGSSWSMWRDLLASNPREISNALDLVLANLRAARDELHATSFANEPEFLALRSLFEEE